MKNHKYIRKKSQAQEIPLTQGYFAKVDFHDFETLSNTKWYFNKGYACHTKTVNGKMKMFYMHREILKAPPGVFVDHINGNTLDNRRSNIRLCNHSENMRNTRHRKVRGTSKYRGVCWNKAKGKWECQIKLGNGKKKFLGYFEDEYSASLAYDKASLKYHGEFGVRNHEESQIH